MYTLYTLFDSDAISLKKNYHTTGYFFLTAQISVILD